MIEFLLNRPRLFLVGLCRSIYWCSILLIPKLFHDRFNGWGLALGFVLIKTLIGSIRVFSLLFVIVGAAACLLFVWFDLLLVESYE